MKHYMKVLSWLLAFAFCFAVWSTLIEIAFHHPHPYYNSATGVWSCPVGYSVYAVESEAAAGKDFVHCIRDKGGK